MVQTSASPSSPQSSSFCGLPSPLRKCPSLPSVSLFIWTLLSPCLPSLSTQATAQLRPSHGPHHRSKCPNVSADVKALYGLLPPHLLHVRLHFLTQLMLLRSWRMPSLQSACHKLKANSNDMLPPQPGPAVPLPADPQSTITVLFKGTSPSSAQVGARNMAHSTICSVE